MQFCLVFYRSLSLYYSYLYALPVQPRGYSFRGGVYNYSAFIPCSSRSLRRRVFSLERALTSLVSASILSDWNFSWIIASSRARQRSRMTKSEFDKYTDSAVEFMDGLFLVIIFISSHVFNTMTR